MKDADSVTNPEAFKQQASQVKEDVEEAARLKAESMLVRQKEAAASQAKKFASVMHKMADEFDHQQQPYFSQCVDELAHWSDGLSQTLRERDIQTLVDQTRNYSRRHPVLFFGGAIAAGFMASRFLQSSAEGSQTSHGASTDQQQGRRNESSL